MTASHGTRSRTDKEMKWNAGPQFNTEASYFSIPTGVTCISQSSHWSSWAIPRQWNVSPGCLTAKCRLKRLGSPTTQSQGVLGHGMGAPRGAGQLHKWQAGASGAGGPSRGTGSMSCWLRMCKATEPSETS